MDPDYSIDVQTWWQQSPFNPRSAAGIPIGGIGSPQPTVNVRTRFGSNTQAAIDSLPSSGGTLFFPPGDYGPFQIVGRSHIHLISDQGATIQGHSLITGCSDTLNYAAFSNSVYDHESAAWKCFTHPVSDFYIKNLTFDGGNQANTAIDISVARDVVFDKVTFQHYVRLDVTDDVGLLNADRGSDNIWCRGCHFVGSQRVAVELAGVHGGGVVDSILERNFSVKWVAMDTNDDFTIDTNGNGKYDPPEQRTSQYIVVADNTLNGSVYQGVGVSGRQNLILGNHEYGVIGSSFAQFSARCSQRGAEGHLVYADEGNAVVDNQVDGEPIFVELDQTAGTVNCPARNFGRLGKVTVSGNVIESAPTGFKLVAEDGTIDGPNTIRDNCINDLSCLGATSPTSANTMGTSGGNR